VSEPLVDLELGVDQGGLVAGVQRDGWSEKGVRLLTHAFMWEDSYKRLKLAQLLGELGVFLTRGAKQLLGDGLEDRMLYATRTPRVKESDLPDPCGAGGDGWRGPRLAVSVVFWP
jgi:hypothetical protein